MKRHHPTDRLILLGFVLCLWGCASPEMIAYHKGKAIEGVARKEEAGTESVFYSTGAFGGEEDGI